MVNLVLKTPGFIEKSDFQFDFTHFYDLGKLTSEKIAEIKTVGNDKITGCCFRLNSRGDSAEKIFVDISYLNTTINEFCNPPKSDLDDKVNLDDKVKKLNLQITSFVEKLEAEYKFKPSLIEFSMFVPSDTKAKLFYTVIYASNKEVIKDYMRELQNNIQSTEDRGPILPNPNLYDFPFLQLDYPDSTAIPVLSVNGQEEAYLFIASQEVYGDEKITEENLVEGDSFKKQVVNFFDAVQKKVLKTKETECNNNYIDLNTAILIPLLRPAGVVESKGDKKTRLKGGGLFLFGEFGVELNKKDQSIQDMVFWITNKTTQALMDQSNTNIDLENEKYKSKASVLHYIPYAFSESVKKLINYGKSHPDFQIPTSLYIVAFETALYARGNEKETLEKFIFGLPVEDTLKDKGLGAQVFEELSGKRGISRLLAEYSLATQSSPIFSKQLAQPEIVVEGYLPFEKLGLTDDVKIRVFIALLIVILKENIEHTERYINNYSPDDEDYRKIKVSIEGNSITIKKPAPEDASSQLLEENNTAGEAIGLFLGYLSPEWQKIEPKREKGWSAYSLIFA